MENLLFNLLQFRVKSEPYAIAIKAYGRDISFRQLLILVKKIAHLLRRAGIQPGQRVITSIANRQVEWLITLALLHEATISCSNHGYAPIDEALDFSWHITDDPQAQASPEIIKLDAAWLDAATKESADIEVRLYEPNSVLRLVLTSGTEGKSKAVGLTYSMMEGRYSLRCIMLKLGQELSMFPMSTIGGSDSAYHTLFSGNPFICWKDYSHIVELINSRGIGFLSASPAQIMGLINFIRDKKIDLQKLEYVLTGGAVSSPSLLAMIREFLANHFINYYGSTEAGGCALFIPSQKNMDFIPPGYSFPQVSIEIVNELSESLPHGAEGSVRIKTPFMAREYVNNPEASALVFRGGWFYPGDRGHLNSEGLLTLTGRDSELINRGGTKFDPVPIELFLIDFDGVKDAAVFSVENQPGSDEVATALVVDEDFDLKTLKQALIDRFGAIKAPSVFFRVNHILRNSMGKTLRSQMSAHLANVIAKKLD